MKTNPSKKTRETVICGVASTKGRGKSIFQGCLIDWIDCHYKHLKCVAFDIGSECSTLCRLFPHSEFRDISGKTYCLDEVINAAASAEWDVIFFDLPSGYHSELTESYKMVDPLVLERNNIRFVCSVVIAPFAESIISAQQTLLAAPSWIQHVAVFNFFDGYYHYRQSFLDLVRKKTISTINIPKYPIDSEHRKIDEQDLTWQMALDFCDNRFDFSFTEREELKKILRLSTEMRLRIHVGQIYSQMEKVKHIYLPSKLQILGSKTPVSDSIQELLKSLDPKFENILFHNS